MCLLLILSGFAVFVLRDLIFKGRSLGKRILALYVYDKNSLTQKVGGKVKEGFKKVEHEVPLQSHQDAFNFEDVEDFCIKVEAEAAKYNIESPKLKARLLMQHILKKPRQYLIIYDNKFNLKIIVLYIFNRYSI